MLIVVMMVGGLPGVRSLRNELLLSRILAKAAFRNDPFLCLPWFWRKAVAMDDSLFVPPSFLR